MKNLKITLMIMLFLSINFLEAEDNRTLPVIITSSEVEPTTDDKLNPELLNTLPAVNILNLSGKDCNGLEIKRFLVHTLPNPDAGILYLANGKCEVTSGQYLTLEEANGLRFDPNENFEGNAIFTYSSVDGSDVVDSSPATVTLPIINGETNTSVEPDEHNSTCVCKAYEKSVSSLTNFGLLAMLLLSIYVGTFFMRKEISL